MNLDLVKTNRLGESSPNFIFAAVNLDPNILEKRWIDGVSWPNDFVEKVNRGEDLRWVGSRLSLTRALIIEPKEFKGGNRVSFWPVLTLWSGGHIDRHVWRWVIVPSDLARSFGAICAHYPYRVIHRAITNVRAWFKSTRERQLTLNKTAWRA